MIIDTTDLAQCPQDGNVFHVMSVIEDPESSTTSGTTSGVTTTDHATTDPAPEDDLYDDHLPQSLVPAAVASHTEQEAVQQSLQQD